VLCGSAEETKHSEAPFFFWAFPITRCLLLHTVLTALYNRSFHVHKQIRLFINLHALYHSVRKYGGCVHRVLYCAVLGCTVLYCAVLYCTVLCCAVLYCAVLYCAVLYCTVLCCAVL
jgi:hypothetical protein